MANKIDKPTVNKPLKVGKVWKTSAFTKVSKGKNIPAEGEVIEAYLDGKCVGEATTTSAGMVSFELTIETAGEHSFITVTKDDSTMSPVTKFTIESPKEERKERLEVEIREGLGGPSRRRTAFCRIFSKEGHPLSGRRIEMKDRLNGVTAAISYLTTEVGEASLEFNIPADRNRAQLVFTVIGIPEVQRERLIFVD